LTEIARRRAISFRWPILVAWCGFLFFYGLSGPLYRTEALRAIIGQASLEGHWLAPTLYGEPFLTKPPGAYAAIGIASWPFGRVTEQTARLPAAIAATLTVLFAFTTLRRSLGTNRAFVAAMLLPISLLWLDKAPSAEIDMLQLAWVAAAFFCFLRAIEDQPLARRASKGEVQHPCLRGGLVWWIASFVCVAAGFLTKWTAPAFFYLAIVPFLWQRGKLRSLFGREHLLACWVASVLCGGWAILAAREVGWQVLVDTIYQEGAQRFAPKASGKPYPWIESASFPFVFLGASLPWSIPALFALTPRYLRKLGDGERRVVVLLHCWAWPNLLFWSLPAQHHVRYVLPICPAITLLGILVLCRWVESLAELRWKMFRPRAAFLAAMVAWASVKIVFVEAVLPMRTADRNVREAGEQLSGLVPEGEILYLCRLKDEGVLFYYGRPARRTADAEALDGSGYVLLLDEEWKTVPFREKFTHVMELRDQQKAAIHLVRLSSPRKDVSGWLAQQHPTRPTSYPSRP
jgi:4-amino-4-deoxy-L-arabinose transferase-like glycosyltransferase